MISGSRLSVPVPSGPPAVQHGSVTFDGPMLTQAFEGHAEADVARWTCAGDADARGRVDVPVPYRRNRIRGIHADGRSLFRLPVKTTSCRWTADADRLVLTLGNESTTTRWRIADDRLTMEVNGQSRVYRRERAGAIPTGERQMRLKQ